MGGRQPPTWHFHPCPSKQKQQQYILAFYSPSSNSIWPLPLLLLNVSLLTLSVHHQFRNFPWWCVEPCCLPWIHWCHVGFGVCGHGCHWLIPSWQLLAAGEHIVMFVIIVFLLWTAHVGGHVTQECYDIVQHTQQHIKDGLSSWLGHPWTTCQLFCIHQENSPQALTPWYNNYYPT